MAEREPVEGILAGMYRRIFADFARMAADPMLARQRQMLSGPMFARQRQMLNQIFWGTGVPREAASQGQDVVLPEERQPAAVEKAPRRKRGRKPKPLIPESDKMNEKAIELVNQLIDEGKSDDEIMEEIWAGVDDRNQKRRKQIRRIRANLEKHSS